MYKPRWSRIRAYLRKKRADAFIIRAPSNIRYLYASHLPHSSSLATFLVVFRSGGVAAITSSLEAHRTRVQGAKGADIHVFTSIPQVEADYKNFNEALSMVLKKNKARKVLCDGQMIVPKWRGQ